MSLMDLYFVNSEAHKTGKHLVHKVGCDYFPLIYNYLGPFSSCQEALEKARRYYTEAEGCQTCCAPHRSKVFFNPS